MSVRPYSPISFCRTSFPLVILLLLAGSFFWSYGFDFIFASSRTWSKWVRMISWLFFVLAWEIRTFWRELTTTFLCFLGTNLCTFTGKLSEYQAASFFYWLDDWGYIQAPTRKSSSSLRAVYSSSWWICNTFSHPRQATATSFKVR